MTNFERLISELGFIKACLDKKLVRMDSPILYSTLMCPALYTGRLSFILTYTEDGKCKILINHFGLINVEVYIKNYSKYHPEITRLMLFHLSEFK